jgi:hypothetical protein
MSSMLEHATLRQAEGKPVIDGAHAVRSRKGSCAQAECDGSAAPRDMLSMPVIA